MWLPVISFNNAKTGRIKTDETSDRQVKNDTTEQWQWLSPCLLQTHGEQRDQHERLQC